MSHESSNTPKASKYPIEEIAHLPGSLFWAIFYYAKIAALQEVFLRQSFMCEEKQRGFLVSRLWFPADLIVRYLDVRQLSVP